MKSIWNLEEGQIREDLKTDKFFQKLSSNNQELIMKDLKRKSFGPAAIGKKDDYIHHGDIKVCPKCEKVRVTSCSACGCGNCETCGYRYSCMPMVNIPNLNFNNTDGITYFVQKDGLIKVDVIEDYSI